MKKVILAVLMAMTLLGVAGCGGTTQGGTNQAASKTATAKQLFPQGVTLLVGFAPGGAVDTGARLLQPYLQQALGVPVVVQNMAGGGGNTAAEYEYRQNADSSTFLMGFLPALTLGQVLGGAKYDVRKFTPLYDVFGNNTVVILAKKGSPLKDFASLRNSGKTLTAGVAGVRSSGAWMAVAFLSALNHVKIKAVPFSGGSTATAAAIGQSIDLASTTVVEAKNMIGAGAVQGVLQFAPKELADLPGVQSIAAAGQTSEAFYQVLGVVGPPNMGAAQAKVMEAALAQAAGSADLAAKAKNAGIEVAPQDSAAWGQTLNQSFDMVNNNKAMLEAFK